MQLQELEIEAEINPRGMATLSVLPVLPEPVLSPGSVSEQQPDIVVRPMLTTAQKNFQDVQNCQTILDLNLPSVSRQDLSVPGSRCFLLHNLLTEEECQHYITESERVGYSNLSEVFPPDYRSNDRILSLNEPLADCLWRRIEPFLTRREVIRVRPMGFGNEGTWKPFRLNECCKFGRYKPGGHFNPHIDGPWVPREDESSIFTVVVYLNSDFEGGATNFLDVNDVGDMVCSVVPRMGTALIFNHDTLHEGQPVARGTKYIIRTEIMYRRVDREMIPDPLAYEEDENYVKTLALYTKSWELEQAGDSKGFTDTYLEALQLQHQARKSVGPDANQIFEQNVPYEIYLKIFGYLTARDICGAMRVCKVWYDMAMDGQLWYDLYRKQWPLGIKLESRIDHTKKTLMQEPGPFIKDWYGLYKQRVLMKSPKKVVVLDLGSFSCKCATLHRGTCSVKTSCIESVVAEAPGIFNLHMRRRNYDRYYCGEEAKRLFPAYISKVVSKGIPVRPALLPEIVTGFYYDCVVRPRYSPVVILQPPGGWEEKVKGQVAHTFVKMYDQPSVCFLSSSVAVLCGMDRTSGVVIDVGEETVTCAAVWSGKELPVYQSCDPAEVSPDRLAEMTEAVVTGCGRNDEMMKTFRENVVLTGGRATDVGALKKELLEKDSAYCVHEPDDRVLAAVNGGSALASLSLFDVFQKQHSFQVGTRRVSPFYKMCISPAYWLFGLSTKSELERHYREKCAANIELQESGCPDSPVYGRKFLEDVSSEEEEEEDTKVEEEADEGVVWEHKRGEGDVMEEVNENERDGNKDSNVTVSTQSTLYDQQRSKEDDASTPVKRLAELGTGEATTRDFRKEAETPTSLPPPSSIPVTTSSNDSSSCIPAAATQSQPEPYLAATAPVETLSSGKSHSDAPTSSQKDNHLTRNLHAGERTVSHEHTAEKERNTSDTNAPRTSSESTTASPQHHADSGESSTSALSGLTSPHTGLDKAAIGASSDPTSLTSPRGTSQEEVCGTRTSAQPRKRGSKVAASGKAGGRRNSKICHLL